MDRRRAWLRDAMTPDEPEATPEYPPPQSPMYAAPAPQQSDCTEELVELADLHDAGVLSDDDYQAKKRQILDI
jgi:hypothetical protein